MRLYHTVEIYVFSGNPYYGSEISGVWHVTPKPGCYIDARTLKVRHDSQPDIPFYKAPTRVPFINRVINYLKEKI